MHYYRITIRFTEPSLLHIQPSNFFLKSKDVNADPHVEAQTALHGCEDMFRQAAAKVGHPNATFHSEVRIVSETELLEYKKNMEAGKTTHQLVN